MSFYCRDLENIVFTQHTRNVFDPDELIIISGYLGPTPIKKLVKLPFKTVVIGGMYTTGVNKYLYEILKKEENTNKKLSVFFSNIEVHSKIYIWRKNKKIIDALIGSANFSNNGLKNDYRESLADMSSHDINKLNDYYNMILQNSTQNPKIIINHTIQNINTTTSSATKRITKKSNFKISVELPLYDSKREVPLKSGLNWGKHKQHTTAHTAEGDAYIAIPKKVLKENPGVIFPFPQIYKSPSNKKRQSDPVEIIWDDGYVMESSFEGTQILNGKNYPKQITSYSSGKPKLNNKRISAKSLLGRYLRKRIGVAIDYPITMDDLIRYGRDSITISLISEGVYYADFSV